MNIDATTLLPHRPPMLMLDRLVEAGPGTAVAEASLKEGQLGVEGGRILEPALVECLAQTVAAREALEAADGGRPDVPGMLVGIAGFRVTRCPSVGERLTLRTREEKRLGPLILVTGEVFVGDERVASGQLKLYG